MKRWQGILIAAALGVGAGTVYVSSVDHVLVGPPQPNEIVPDPEPAPPPNGRPAPAVASPTTAAPTAVAPLPREEPRAPAPASDAGPAQAVPGIGGLTVPLPRTARDGTVIYPLTGTGVSDAITAAMPDIAGCYQSWHTLQPSLEGALNVKMVIAGDGGSEGGFVEEISLFGDAGMGHAAFEGCVLSVLDTLRFEAPEGGGKMTIHYPFSFRVIDPDGGG
jgi:hypothetical protein